MSNNFPYSLHDGRSVLRLNNGSLLSLCKKVEASLFNICGRAHRSPVCSFLVFWWFILRGDFLYVFPCVILFLCFSVLLVLRLPRLGKRELILVLFVRLFGLCLLYLSVSSSSWGLGRAAVCDCGTPWTFLLPFFQIAIEPFALFHHSVCN